MRKRQDENQVRGEKKEKREEIKEHSVVTKVKSYGIDAFLGRRHTLLSSMVIDLFKFFHFLS